MFHLTNFTESSTNVHSLSMLMRTALMFWERLPHLGVDPETADHIELSNVASRLSDQFFMEMFGQKCNPKFEGHSFEQIGIWTSHAVAMEWYARWGDLAFPRIQTSHSFATMLMATTISSKELVHVEAPWPAFLIEVPEGLLPITLEKGTVTHIRRIHVTPKCMPGNFPDESWALWMVGPGVEIHRVGSLSEITTPRNKTELSKVTLTRIEDNLHHEPKDRSFASSDEELASFWEGYSTTIEDRLAVLVGRLVIGLCVFMTTRANYTEKVVKPDGELAAYARRLGKKPESRIFKVGRPVKLDFRLAIRSYLEGSRGPVTVQSLVAGHHKRQAHGPNNSLRKWIFVEPYWRGPEEGAVVVRPHLV